MRLGANPPLLEDSLLFAPGLNLGQRYFLLRGYLQWTDCCSSPVALSLSFLFAMFKMFLPAKTPVWGCAVESRSSVLQPPTLPSKCYGWKNRGRMTVWYHLPCQWSHTRNNCCPALCLGMSRDPKQVTGGTRWILQSALAHVVACPLCLFR